MIDLTIEGTLSRSGEIQGECVWCRRPSTSRAWAKGIGREVPCHVLCCAAIIRAYRQFLDRGIESPDLRAYALRLEEHRLLGPGA